MWTSIAIKEGLIVGNNVGYLELENIIFLKSIHETDSIEIQEWKTIILNLHQYIKFMMEIKQNNNTHFLELILNNYIQSQDFQIFCKFSLPK